jgi:hypothetical protein
VRVRSLQAQRPEVIQSTDRRGRHEHMSLLLIIGMSPACGGRCVLILAHLHHGE